MRRHSLMIVSALAIGLATPVSAQQTSTRHLYMLQFKNAPQASKAMIESPQDRSVPVRKLVEGFGGKLLGYYSHASRLKGNAQHSSLTAATKSPYVGFNN
jgi:hypothetical protein